MFDRAAQERSLDLATLLADAGVIVSDGNQFAVSETSLFLVEAGEFAPENLMFLGRLAGRPVFVTHGAPAHDAPLDFRKAAMAIDAQQLELLLFAKAMLHWSERTRFCSRCATALVSRSAGYARLCPNEACGAEWFPRLDPAVIMLVTNGDRALLGRHHRYASAFTTFAGFVEAGETIEQAAERELAEETGLRATSIRYVASQPWPLPSSLMLGFRVEAEGTLAVDPGELIEARWFTREELREGIASGETVISSTLSIAGRLIQGWMEETHS
jgi:NAD+ diphosphatase